MAFVLRSAKPITLSTCPQAISGATLALFFSLPVWADITGKVVAVSDGDTITISDASKTQYKIHIAGIDAPESKHAYGTRSKDNLNQLLHGKDVRVDCPKIDRFGQQVCKVWVQPSDCPQCGETLDVGYAQISAGLAWWYRAYAKEQSAEDRGRYESEEADARLRKRGLWVDAQPVPPWEWRWEPDK